MRTIALDINNDWDLLKIKSNNDCIIQSLETRLRCIRNNDIFDRDLGIDFNDFDPGRLDSMISRIKQIILQTIGITKINSFEYNLDSQTRGLLINFNVDSIYTKNINLNFNL